VCYITGVIFLLDYSERRWQPIGLKNEADVSANQRTPQFRIKDRPTDKAKENKKEQVKARTKMSKIKTSKNILDKCDK